MTARSLKVGLTGGAIGLLIAAVQAFVNRGEVPWWQWALLPLVVAALFVWLVDDGRTPP